MSSLVVNRLRGLQAFGQSIWLDELQRGMLQGPLFARLVNEDCVSGVTSNPSIFAKAFAHDASYRPAIEAMLRTGATAEQIYERLACEDIRTAADQLLDLYNQTQKRDGYVSMEVAPRLAHDANATVDEARRLWASIARPNAMIKVPATDQGILALRRLIADGINVNATLIFGEKRYCEVADAFMSGLEDRVARGHSLVGIASVASFFISRIDTHVDTLLDALAPAEKRIPYLRGCAAIAAARMTYQQYKALVNTPRWQSLTGQHAQSQRLLWASTRTKDPKYSDTKYVEQLIGPDTINTLPMATLDAFRDHGMATKTVEVDLPETSALVSDLLSLGINLEQVSVQLQAEGLKAFESSMNALLSSIAKTNAVAAT